MMKRFRFGLLDCYCKFQASKIVDSVVGQSETGGVRRKSR
jgi:hypothetical protein